MQAPAYNHSFDTVATLSKVVFSSYNGKDRLILPIKNLLWVQAQENYVQFCWEDGDRVHSTLLRNTFATIKKQLPDNFVQTHRSFMVNLRHLRHLNKRVVGFELKVGNSQKVIPVSKSYAKPIADMIRNEMPHLRP
ncbi:MAG TPA: hypothetical protein DCE41_06365 [Cytophagales bacterium]|nr:hypothetical protein [Cytophagales bacterium]HAA19554.1 hypothetical protein [Cytophagales bacterium]HAP63186.1 hypothetical protein [Cytophagales bacterium]